MLSRCTYRFALMLLPIAVSPTVSRAQESLPPSPLTAIAKRLAAPVATDTKPSKNPATRFSPTGKRTMAAQLVEKLAQNDDQKAALRDALTAGRIAYEAEAKKAGCENDVAAALSYYVAANWSVYNGGKEPSGSGSLSLIAQMQTMLDSPEMRAAKNADKEALYEWCVTMSVLTQTLYAASKDNPKMVVNLRASAGVAIKDLLNAEPGRVQITDKGLEITPLGGGGRSGLSYTLPVGWSKTGETDGTTILEHGGGDTDLDRDCSYRLMILPATPKQGNLAKTWKSVWANAVLTNFSVYAGAFNPLPFLTRLPGGLAVAFDGELMVPKNVPGGKGKHVFLYLIDAGDKVFPLIGIEDYGYWGGKSRETVAAQSFFNSLRVTGYTPDKKPLVTDREALVGDWSESSFSAADFVTASGGYAGDAGSGAGSTATLRADGTYRRTVIMKLVGKYSPPQTTTGRWKLEDNALILTPTKKGEAVSQYRIVGLSPRSGGKGSVLIIALRDVPLIFESRENFWVWAR
ncbi:MAG: hypothetical protein H7Y38_14625 [Armatimonadetes bacterium]|nr:hypothetical protein [Armatimonadota bacterium]